MIFQLTVRGIPKAQGRARAFAFKKGDRTHVRMYDPETSRDWKRTVQHEVALEVQRLGMKPIEGAVRLDLAFLMPRPKSLPKRVRDHTKKPDVDNLAKAVKDALRGVLYRDDSQVASLRVVKLYGDQPGVQIFATSDDPL